MKKGWKQETLGSVCDIQSGSGFPEKFQGQTGEKYPFYKVSDMNLPGNERIMTSANNTVSELARKELRARIFPPGSVIFPKVGGAISTNKKRLTSQECCVDNNVMGLIPNKKFISADYLFYYMQNIDIYDFSNKANPPSIRQTAVESWPIHLPNSISEQERIVAILDKAFDGIDASAANAEKNLDNASELFNSFLNSLFVHKNKGWVKRKLEDTVEETCSLSYGIVQPGEDVDGGLPIVRPTDLQAKIIYLKGLKRINPALAEGYKRTKLYGGELLLCVRGGTGSVSIAADELAGANVTRGIVPIRFDKNVVLQEFGYFIFLSKSVQDQIKAATYGAALMQINIRDLKKISLDLPPLEIQEVLLKTLKNISSEVERLSLVYKQKAAMLAELKQTILENAFAGELTLRSAGAVQEAAE